MIKKSLYFIIIFIPLLSCSVSKISKKEAVYDKKSFEQALVEQNNIKHSLRADAETQPVISDNITDDCADDPAIWYNSKFPEKSIVFGSNKKRGIHSYDLTGKQKQFISYAKINNIDIRQNIILDNKEYDILGGSNKSDKSIDLFIIDSNGKVKNKPDFTIGLGENFKPYGFCLYKNPKGQFFAFVNDKKGNVFQIKIDIKDNKFLAKTIKKFKLNSQVEGMVADDKNEKLYVAEEDFGIHIFDLKNPDNKPEILNGSTKDNTKIRFDIEGIALLPPHYLVASSQGNFTYAIFDLMEKKYITSFKIISNIVDGVEDTDGLEIYTGYLNKKYPKGILVVQDGFNFDNDTLNFQNFKIIDIRKINKLIKKTTHP